MTLSYTTLKMLTSFCDVAEFHVQYYFAIVTVECAQFYVMQRTHRCTQNFEIVLNGTFLHQVVDGCCILYDFEILRVQNKRSVS